MALGVITNVTKRQLVKKETQETFFMYDIDTTIGKMQTTKRDIAESAFSLLNQTAELDFTTKHNGTYTNIYLNKVLPAPSNPAAQAQMAQTAGASDFLTQTAGVVATSGIPTSGTGVGTNITVTSNIPDEPSVKQQSIHRQTATKVAAALNPETVAAFWANVHALVKFYETGADPLVPLPAGGLGAESTSDDDIPF